MRVQSVGQLQGLTPCFDPLLIKKVSNTKCTLLCPTELCEGITSSSSKFDYLVHPLP